MVPTLVVILINAIGLAFKTNYEGAVIGSIVGMLVGILAVEIKAKFN